MSDEMDKKDFLYEQIEDIESIYKGSYLDLERRKVSLPDNRSAYREVVRVKNAVGILPIDSDGNAYLVRQHRTAIDKTIIEIPAGLIDENETLEEAAIRELREEAGIEPEELVRLISYSHAEGYSTGFITLYASYGIVKRSVPSLDENEFIEQFAIPFDELLEMVLENRIVDSKTIISVLLADKRRKKE